MSEPMNPDRLYQLLADLEPAEIRKRYAEALQNHPECHALLREFEGLDQDFVELGTLSTPPEPDWSRIRGTKSGILVQLQRFALPLAAVLVLGIALASQVWRHSSPTESQVMVDRVMAEPMAAPGSEDDLNESGPFPDEPIAAESFVEALMPLKETFSDVAQTPRREDADSLERSAITPGSAARAKREASPIMQQLQTEDEAASAREPASVLEPEATDGLDHGRAEVEEMAVVIRKTPPPLIRAWECWRDAALAFYENPDAATEPLLADELKISWSLLGLENAGNIAFYEALARLQSAGTLGFQAPYVEGDAVLVTWVFSKDEQMASGRLKLTVNPDCQVTQWQELQ